ncbi:retrovirus-related Pol polyprotein from transposon 297 [Trichonephila clavipes]|nr:retrovirus-related Pol polyprotein from transposon 297 [Trichonephila clavipes]
MAEGGKALHSLCDSSWSLPILCYALRDEERREYLSKSYGSGASETPGILSIIYRRCNSFLQNMGTAHETSVCSISNDSKVGFTINLKKCNFARRRVKFLGHVVGSGQHSPDPGKNDKEPSSNIIPWNEVAEQAFTKLKAQLVKAPSLYTPDLSKPYQLYTDASATAIGACLSQNDVKGKENQLHFSVKHARNSNSVGNHRREAYAVIEALKRWIAGFSGPKLMISDHNPLTYLTLTTPQSAKLTRWALALKDIILLFHTGRALNMEMLMHYPGCLFPLVKNKIRAR